MPQDPYANPMTVAPPIMPPGADPDEWYNADPVAGFWQYLRNQGLAGLDPTSGYAQGQYNKTENLFRTDAAKNPSMGFYDYLQANQPAFDFAGQYRSLAPGQRGDTSDRTTAARGRWVTPR